MTSKGMKFGPRSAEYKARLSAALKARWASGQRRKNFRASQVKAGETIRMLNRKGLLKKMSDEDRRRVSSLGGQVAGNSQNTKAHLQALAKARIGLDNPPGPSAKGAGHWKSKWWQFRSPSNIVIDGMNLNQIVRDNTALFDPMDVVWVKSACRASKGLHQLAEINGRSCSWKGWTIVGSRERSDMLNRKNLMLPCV